MFVLTTLAARDLISTVMTRFFWHRDRSDIPYSDEPVIMSNTRSLCTTTQSYLTKFALVDSECQTHKWMPLYFG